jgi:hypothetical protein
MKLERRIQDALRHHAPRGRDTEQIGPFLATFTRDTANPYLNYAIPDEGGTATPDDVQALVDAYRARERQPRLEYIPSVAPRVEAALLEAGFEIEGRLPLMTCATPRFEVPVGIELVSPSTEEEFRGVAGPSRRRTARPAILPTAPSQGFGGLRTPAVSSFSREARRPARPRVADCASRRTTESASSPPSACARNTDAAESLRRWRAGSRERRSTRA